MQIIQIKKIEFSQDERGWCIRPITDGDMRSDIIGDVHIVSMKPGTIRGNHYHVHKTEHIIFIGSVCRVLVVDNKTKKEEQKIVENYSNVLLIIPPDVTHAIENIGNEVSYLFCFSKVEDSLKSDDVVKNKIL